MKPSESDLSPQQQAMIYVWEKTHARGVRRSQRWRGSRNYERKKCSGGGCHGTLQSLSLETFSAARDLHHNRNRALLYG